MIRLPNTGTYSLELVTAQNGAQVVVCYSDATSAAYTGGTQTTAITSATTTTICDTPAASTVRDVDEINIKNTFAGSHTITVQLDVAATNVPVITASLLTNESLNYTHGSGWQLKDASGNTKTANAIASMTSSQLAAAVTDETGSGLLVFATSPLLTTPQIVGGSFKYTLTGGSLAADRVLNVPVTTATDTLATLGLAQTWTAAQTFRAASAVRSEAASTQDAMILAGRAGGSSSYAVTLTPTTLTASRTVTFPDAATSIPVASYTYTIAGPTAARTHTYPDADFSVGYINVPQNSQSTAYTAVLADAGKHLLHPSADTTARTFTIPANSSVAYPIGTALTFVNQAGAGVMTIAITTDTMRLAGAGTTGSRTLAANGIATALKLTSTEWIISGTGLT